MADIEKMHKEFLKREYITQDHFLTSEQCAYFLDQIAQFQQQHSLAVIHRAHGERPLHYKVINGEQIEQYLPEIEALYKQLGELSTAISGAEMVPLSNKRVGVNVNITPGAGTYRWHYDRNAVTVLLYLNEVTGGEIELYPQYRLFLNDRGPAFLQQLFDRLLRIELVRHVFGRKVVVVPAPGRMVVMRGNRCLHSVRSVEGDRERVNIVLAYDAGERQPLLARQALDQYLYSQEPVTSI
jgi:2OG-Fe(II) oxygenase superfamily